jgi:hypothetical protein
MAQTTAINLLSASSHTSPAGEFMQLTGDSQEAASYYVAGRSLQTFAWSFSNSFVGNVFLQATLYSEPTETDWFDVEQLDLSASKNGFLNFTGNFVLFRAKVTDWAEGNINFVTVSY